MWDLRRRFFGDDTGPRSGPPTSKAKHVIVKGKKARISASSAHSSFEDLQTFLVVLTIMFVGFPVVRASILKGVRTDGARSFARIFLVPAERTKYARDPKTRVGRTVAPWTKSVAEPASRTVGPCHLSSSPTFFAGAVHSYARYFYEYSSTC